ncbi:serine/threonine-protein phosphatase 4 regulatory subunit 4-like isoform X2 [Sipha flava]|uniref:Serine/threonine-protein phosphatase 4 regulatory subunit 4-like isoform X2 n=1 Tax=Sipha flava TaxID=143950 RepID=A0A8B8GQY2_9HEMI|nr:serine/threonine-protein phosphatase 4 regulatory subunit 4-like isoform X2 [Sipha flava]
MQHNDSKDLADCHYEATETVRNILKKQLLTADLFQQTFLSTILTALDNHSDNNNSVINTWLDTLLDFIEFLPVDCLQQEILPFAIEKSNISKTESSRLISCRIFGSLASKLNGYIIKREIWPCILSLCQDESVLVRKTVCQELSKVSAFLKDDTDNLKDCVLLPAIVDLANDADYGVKVAMLNVIVDIIPCFPKETIITVILPMVKKLIDTNINKSTILVVAVAKNYGIICKALKDYLNFDDVSWFINKYTDLLNVDQISEHPCNNDNYIYEQPYLTVQMYCARSLTDIVLLSSSDKGSTTLLIFLINHLIDLVTDSYVEIKIALVGVIKEVLVTLNDKVVLISSVLMKLLSERNIKVLKVLIPNLSFMITKMKYQEQVLKSLMLLEEYLCAQYNWRLYTEFLHQLMVLPTCYTSDQVFRVGRVMFDRLECRQKPIKEAVCTLLLTILRYNLDANQRTLLREHLIDRTVQSPSFYRRTFYIFICQEALNLFSTAYFKKHFFSALLMLADDKVANIRYSLCNIMPNLVNIFKISTEKSLVDKLICTINILLVDEDRSVLEQRPILEYCNASINHIIQSNKSMSEYAKTDDDMIKFREESCLLLMKPSERINLDNSGMFLRSLIEEKMCSSQIDDCSRISNEDGKISLASKKAFMLESEFIKDTGVSINKMMEHSSKIPTPVYQTLADTKNSKPSKETKISHLPIKKDRKNSPVYRSQKRYDSNEHVITRTTNITKRNATSRGKRLSVPVMSSINVDITKDANGNLVKFASKRPQSCYVENHIVSKNKIEKSLSDEALDKTSKNKPLSRLPIRKSQGK